MRRSRILLFCCFALLASPLYSLSQDPVQLADLAGKWQENSRLKKSVEVSFNDTLRLEIRSDGFMMIRVHNGPTLTEEAEVKGKRLKMGNRQFGIVEIQSNRLVLNDKQGDHVFLKTPEFTAAPIQRSMPGVETGLKDLSFTTLRGKWTCYKKTDPAFNRTRFYVKSIDFIESKTENEFNGMVHFNNNDSVYQRQASFMIDKDQLRFQTSEETTELQVLKSDGEELILKQGNIHYFMKRFGSQ